MYIMICRRLCCTNRSGAHSTATVSDVTVNYSYQWLLQKHNRKHWEQQSWKFITVNSYFIIWNYEYFFLNFPDCLANSLNSKSIPKFPTCWKHPKQLKPWFRLVVRLCVTVDRPQTSVGQWRNNEVGRVGKVQGAPKCKGPPSAKPKNNYSKM